MKSNIFESYNAVAEEFKKYLLANAYEASTSALMFDKSQMILWDPRNGEIEFEVYVPTELPELKTLLSFDYKQHIHDMKDWINTHITDPIFIIWDIYYQYKPTPDITNWIPPFKGTVQTFHSCIKCLCRMGYIHDHTFNRCPLPVNGNVCTFVTSPLKWL